MPQKNNRLEIGFVLFLLAVFGVFLWVGLGYPVETGRLPVLTAGVAMALLIVQLLRVLFKPGIRAGEGESGPAVDWRKSLLCFAVLGASLGVAFLFGIIVAAVGIVFGCGLVFGAKKMFTLSVVALATGILVYAVFVRVFNVTLYRGILF